MKKIVFLAFAMMLSSIVGDVPEWEEGMAWKYRIDSIDFTLSEVEGRYIDVSLKSGELEIEVKKVNSSFYITSFYTQDLDISIDVYLNLTGDPIVFSCNFSNATLEGEILFDRSNLGIVSVKSSFFGELELESLPFDVPPILLHLVPVVPLTINTDIQFNESYPLIDFPIDIGKLWGLPARVITIDGTIESKLLRLAYILNKIAKLFGKELISPEFSRFLPVIDISEVLNAYGIANEIEIPSVPENIMGIPAFECLSEEKVSVEAGNFSAYNISIIDGICSLYYSPEAKMVVKIVGNFKDIFPFMEDVSIELLEMEVP
jgi:hypothetical protein